MIFTSDVYEKETFTGRIEIINPVIDPKTHTLEVKALVRNPGFRLRPGMFIRANITSGEAREMILIPTAAIVPGEGEAASVFVIRQNVCYKQAVRLGRQLDNVVEIKEGLNPGDMVAADNVSQLREGLKVRELKEEEEKKAE